MCRKSINIIGAFDRYNYGDLLFPIIIEEYIRHYKPQLLNNYDLNYFGLIDSDLSYVGGKKTKALSTIYTNQLVSGSIILISGGDVLHSRISCMNIDLSKSQGAMICRKAIRKIIGNRIYDNISMAKFGVKAKFPWIINNEDFNGNIKILYNSVGGSTIDKLNKEEILYIRENLKKSDFLSVRDNKSFNNIDNEETKISPDSASIMSLFFTFEKLEERVSKEIRDYANNEKRYFCIQTNLSSIKGNEKALVKEIEKISKESDLRVLLLPIGIASNHDDNIALRRLYKYFKQEFTHFDKVNIYEIMYLIAKSRFFAGTSLHGNITAMSYGVPHIGLGKNITKLDQYLKTWDLEEQGGCIGFEELFNKFQYLINIDKSSLIIKKDELIDLCIKNFEDMFKIVF